MVRNQGVGPGVVVRPWFLADCFAKKRRCHLERFVVPRTLIQQQQQQPELVLNKSVVCVLLCVVMGPGPFQVINRFELRV